MKSLLALSVASLILLGMSVNAEAQIFDRLKKKAKESAEKKLEEKASQEIQKHAEQMVEKSWDSVFGEANYKSGGLPFSLNNNVTAEDAYHFTTVTTMKIETMRKDGKQDPAMIMQMHFNKDAQYTGTKFISEEMKPEDGELFIIYDFKNSAMLMLMSNDKDKFSFAYDWKQAMDLIPDSVKYESEQPTESEQSTEEDTETWPGYSKIGTKEIAGYSCEGYQSQTNDAKTEIWVTRDADYGGGDMFKANANAKQLKGKLPDDYPYGMLMEMVSEDLTNGDKTTMRVTDIQKDANITYTMADYPTISLAQKKS